MSFRYPLRAARVAAFGFVALLSTPAFAACGAAPTAAQTDSLLRLKNPAATTWSGAVGDAGSAVEGDFVYDGTNQVVAFCNGTAWVDVATGGTTLNGITAATANQAAIANAGHMIQWNWDTLAGGSALTLASISTAAASNAQTMLNIALSGTNGTSAQTTYGEYISNTHAGTTSTDYGIYATASGGTTNNIAIEGATSGTNGGDSGLYGIASGASGATYGVYGSNASSAGFAGYFNQTSTGYAAAFMGGNVGIGTTTPSDVLDVSGAIGFTATTSSPPTTGIYSSVAGELDFATTGGKRFQIVGGTLSIAPGGARTLNVNRSTVSGNAGNALTLQAGGAFSGGSNLNGGTLTLAGGISTGSGTSTIQFNVYPGAAGATSDNAATTAMTILGNGSVGIGTTSPATGMQADINGPVKIAGTGSEACSASTVGAVRYNAAGNYMEICSYP